MNTKNKIIKVAITVWGNRVSPVFDTATTLLIAEISETGIDYTYRLAFTPKLVNHLLGVLAEREITTVICGAISEEPANLLESAGVELISFIAGNINRVLHNYIQEQPDWSELSMPGCQKNICCQGRIRKGHELGAMFVSENDDGQKRMRMPRRWGDEDRQN